MDPRLNPHLASVLPPFDLANFAVRRIDALELLHGNARFDLIPKLLYASDRLDGGRRAWVRTLYTDHIACFNDGQEGDASGKCSAEHFLQAFDELIDSLRDGFDPGRSLIPVDSRLTIIDGAHRVAAAAALRLTVEVAVLPTWKARTYDLDWFVTRGLDRGRCETASAEALAIDPRAHVAVFYPASRQHHDKMLGVLASQGQVLLTVRYELDRRSALSLIREIYHREPWLGSPRDCFAGAQAKAEACCGTGGSAMVILFRTASSCDLRSLKEGLRARCGIDKHAIHIDDGGPEALRLARTLIPPTSRAFIAGSVLGRTSNFDRLMDAMVEACATQRELAEQHCIDGGAVLAAYGLRDTEDLDVISRLPTLPVCVPGINRRVDIAAYYGPQADELLSDPVNHFWHRGICFLAPALVAEVKRQRGEGKDAEDLGLLSGLGACRRDQSLAISLRAALHRASRRLRACVPEPAKRAVRLLRKVARRAKANVQELPDLLSAGDLQYHWKGLTVYYRRGDSLIRRIRRTCDYEPHVTVAAQGLLAGIRDPLVLDIGSNIGLFALALLDARSDCTIEAFDPGPLQQHLLARTVAHNGLGARIHPHGTALGEMDGPRQFAVHTGGHCSGDGFLDTNRAGSTRTIEVQCARLDTWWEAAGRPRVDLIKIDAEGAESMILAGGSRVIAECRPRMLIEINALNLKPYGLDPEAMRTQLGALGYAVLGTDGSRTPDIAASLHGGDDMFIALPQDGLGA